MNLKYLITTLVIALLNSCGGGELPVPKPRSFPRVMYPERQLTQLGPDYCDFDFTFPDYAKVEQKELFFDEAPAHPCWFDLYLEPFDGRVHFSYYPIKDEADWEYKRDQAFDLAGFHNKRASNIKEIRINAGPELGGMIFDINGPAASPYQFFLTDSTQHFVRGALYFNTQSRPDSLKPIIDFVVEDINTMIETFEWRQ